MNLKNESGIKMQLQTFFTRLVVLLMLVLSSLSVKADFISGSLSPSFGFANPGNQGTQNLGDIGAIVAQITSLTSRLQTLQQGDPANNGGMVNGFGFQNFSQSAMPGGLFMTPQFPNQFGVGGSQLLMQNPNFILPNAGAIR